MSNESYWPYKNSKEIYFRPSDDLLLPLMTTNDIYNDLKFKNVKTIALFISN